MYASSFVVTVNYMYMVTSADNLRMNLESVTFRSVCSVITTYRVIQERRSVFWEVIILVMVRKNYIRICV